MSLLSLGCLAVWWLSGAVESSCPSSPYRSEDGSCNNVRHPAWGARSSQYLRLIEPHHNRSAWVSPNSVLSTLERTFSPSHHSHVTALLGLWAEFLYRDLTRPSINKEGNLVNAATGFLDGSDLYNVVYDHSLKETTGHINIQACSICASGSGLGGLYTALYEEHNRIVDRLSKINTNWSGEKQFQEAKKIVTAQIQHITNNEFLPTILGEGLWPKVPQDKGFYNGYSSANLAGTYYESAMSVLHFLPTMVPPTLISMGLKSQNKTNFNTESVMTDMITSALTTPAQIPSLHFNTFDGYLSASQILESSRLNDLPWYSSTVHFCTNKSVQDFNEFSSMGTENQKLLSSVYPKATEIDLLIGGVLENLAHGSLVGPTFSCLLLRQFATLRDSDRFWYENDLPPSSFTKNQLTELRKVTLSGLLCENVRNLRSLQPNAFVQEDPYLNAAIICDHHSMFELEPWKDNNESEELSLSPEQVKEALRKAEEDLARRQRQEYVTYANLGGVDPKSPVGTAAAFSKPNRMALTMANNSLLFEYASQELMESITAKQARRRRQSDGDNVISFAPDIPVKDFLSDLDIAGIFPTRHVEPECHEESGPCDPRTPYRTFTGHCNNLDRPNLGRSLTTFARLLPAVYENGISSPRINTVTGIKLPSARLVSSMIHVDISHLHTRYTLMLMQFAQFVDHDITFTPNHRGFFASIPDCRACDSALTVHPECMPIHIPSGDPFYPQQNISTGERLCLPFMRSLPGQQRLGSREQINQNSAYLDASHIFGEHACLGRDLKGFGGRLNVTVHPTRGKDLLPISPVHPECKAPSGYCFIAGDGRASEQPGLTAMHTVYMREHNRLVEGLHSLNPHWSDEKLYQQARRILTASYQHTIYNEFLPRLLGWNAVNLYGLKLQHHGYYKGYSASCNPNIVTEFATAAYRIGHSLLRPHIPRMSPAYTPIEPAILLRDVFFNPDIIYQPHIIDEIMRGLVGTPMENLDQFITGEISNHLFEDRRVPHSGMDLPALNIQRARDHGIPPYNEYRSLCNLKRAATWDDLSREIPAEVIARLRLIYPTVNDIDLFPGGLSERPLQGGLVGPTFACIIGLQFRQLRKCDRFWYESGDPLVRFTEGQLAELRKATLSKIVCDNLDVQSDMQRSAFDQASDFLNPRLPCHSLPSIDLSAWRESVKPGCQIAGRTVPVGESALPTPCTSCICTTEGAQCASLRVTDCGRLLREAGRDAVLRDDVCSAQCSALLLDSPGPTLEALEEVVSLTTHRPPSRSRGRGFPTLLPPPLRHRRPPLRKFTITDLPSFLG